MRPILLIAVLFLLTSPSWAVLGRALHFDGTANSYVTPLSAAPVDGHSLCVWIRTSVATQTLVARGSFFVDDEEQFNIVSTHISRKMVNTLNSEVTGSINVTDGNWHRLVYTVTVISGGTSTITLYVDGVLDIQTASVPNFTPATTGFKIGQTLLGGNRFTGDMDELVTTSSVMDQTAVTADYNGGIGRYGLSSDSGVQQAWHFDEGPPSQAVSSYGTANKATLNSTTAVTFVTGVVSVPNVPLGPKQRRR